MTQNANQPTNICDNDVSNAPEICPNPLKQKRLGNFLFFYQKASNYWSTKDFSGNQVRSVFSISKIISKPEPNKEQLTIYNIIIGKLSLSFSKI